MAEFAHKHIWETLGLVASEATPGGKLQYVRMFDCEGHRSHVSVRDRGDGRFNVMTVNPDASEEHMAELPAACVFDDVPLADAVAACSVRRQRRGPHGRLVYG